MNSLNCIWYTYFPPICLVKHWGSNFYLKFNMFLHYECRQQTTQQSYWFLCNSILLFVFKKYRSSLVAQKVKNPPAMWETWFNPWVGKIPWKRTWQPTPVFLPGESPQTEEPGRLQSMGSQRVGHNWETKHTHTKYPVKGFTNHSIKKVHGTNLQTLGKILKGKKGFLLHILGKVYFNFTIFISKKS